MELFMFIIKIMVGVTVILACAAAITMIVWLLIDTYETRQWAKKPKESRGDNPYKYYAGKR